MNNFEEKRQTAKEIAKGIMEKCPNQVFRQKIPLKY